jgi:hypothetical protein
MKQVITGQDSQEVIEDFVEDKAMEAMGEDREGYIKRHIQKYEEAAPSDTIVSLTPEQLKTQLAIETEKRKLLVEYINEHLVEGVDYGKIHVVKNCYDKYNCKIPHHYSKNVLFKPGGEKFCSLFRLRAEFRRDNETWEMMGKVPGLVCLICTLQTANGLIAGEEKGNPNTAIKIAEKRAKLDAVLATGGLSDFFTQDLEDTNGNEQEVINAQKRQIVFLINKLQPGIVSKEGYRKTVKVLTDMDLVESNYPEIISRLSVLVKERQETKTP